MQAELERPARKGKNGWDSEGGKDKPVDVIVPMPKSMRKRLKTRAAEQGMTAEDAAFHVLRVWLTS